MQILDGSDLTIKFLESARVGIQYDIKIILWKNVKIDKSSLLRRVSELFRVPSRYFFFRGFCNFHKNPRHAVDSIVLSRTRMCNVNAKLRRRYEIRQLDNTFCTVRISE